MKRIGVLRKINILIIGLILTGTFLGLSKGGVKALALENTMYGEAYRNHLSYSPQEGWNNDPNGLVYVDGVYHMYYQYNWDQRSSTTDMVWGNMSWGHATSTDLVHWEEHKVALPAYQDVDQQWYGMMFSGSAVYDVNNTSGLFEVKEDGTIQDGQGIVAILTQPTDVQRQILAYSYDNGESFHIYGEILGANCEGSLGDNEFRDPKVFWSEEHHKWLMVVGGGAVRMYASSNLKDWEYLGQTGFWGECPDISCYTVDGEKKYALIISPEDKPQSHRFNETTRKEFFYPAEYYTVGDLTEEGLFVSSQPLKRLSEGVDSYAFQSFNHSPDGKVYGVSWSACWKNVDSYKDIRKTYNGGMTIACELTLEKNSDGYTILRKPVEQFSNLRTEKLAEYDGVLKQGTNAFSDVTADIADFEIEFDFSNSTANKLTLELRKSLAEEICITYNKEKQELIFDRTKSSLLAEHTPYYNWKNVLKNVEAEDNKLSLRILLDRAFISVFVNGGQQSIFSAVFPSAVSNELSLKADADIHLRTTVHKMASIFGEVLNQDALLVTSQKLDLTVLETKRIVTSSYATDVEVVYSILEGKENIELYQDGNVAFVKGVQPGVAKILANTEEIPIYIYEAGFVSDVDYTSSLYGYSYETEQGLVVEYPQDAFLFSEQYVTDFTYEASIEMKENGQAAGLLFGLSENCFDYVVATVDFKDNLIKLWQAGIGDLKVIEYDFKGNRHCKLSVQVEGKTIKVMVNEEKAPVLTYLFEEYTGGKLGLNVYNAGAIFNHITLVQENSFEFDGTASLEFMIEGPIEKIVNITDHSYRLKENEYTVDQGKVKISKEYLCTLKADETYVFRVITSTSWKDKIVKTSFTSSKLTSEKKEYSNTEEITFTLDGASTIQSVYLDGLLLEGYQMEGMVVSLPKEIIKNLVNGSHTLTIYTENGRPEVQFTITEVFVAQPDDAEVANHIFFYVDIAIFAFLILGYSAFSIYKRRKQK